MAVAVVTWTLKKLQREHWRFSFTKKAAFCYGGFFSYTVRQSCALFRHQSLEGGFFRDFFFSLGTLIL